MNILQVAFIVACGLVLLTIVGQRYRLTILVAVGLALRSFLAIADDSIYWLPWSGSDSKVFYAKLVAMTRLPAVDALLSPPLSTSSMYPWLLSWFARLFGESYLFAVFLNVLLGTFNIIQTHRFALELLDKRQARIAAWFTCLFPVSAVLSAVLIRETLIATFLLAAITYFVRSIKTRQPYQLGLAAMFIFMAAVFHGALILCLIIFPFSYAIASAVSRRYRGERLASPLRTVGTSILLLVVIFLSGPKLSKIGDADELMDRLDARQTLESKRTVARNSDYPVFLSRSIFRPDIAFLRYCYFMFAPFPWMWRGPMDILGAGLGAANFYGFYLGWRYRRRLNSLIRTLYFCVLLTTIMFSAGVNNVGTAIRHRNKVIPIFFCASLATYVNVHQRKKRSLHPALQYSHAVQA